MVSVCVGRSGRSGGAVSLEQVLLLLPSILAFGKFRGLYIISVVSPVMPLLSSLVTIFVFQVDDSNADKNVSSAQIVGKLEILQAQCRAHCWFLITDCH